MKTLTSFFLLLIASVSVSITLDETPPVVNIVIFLNKDRNAKKRLLRLAYQ